MRTKKILAIFTAAAMAVSLTGCLDDDEETLSTAEAQSDVSDTQPNSEPEYDNSGRVFDKGATQLSMNGGDLAINRRSRSASSPMGENGWTILVYLCGTDLESDAYAATSDIIEAVSAQYSDDVRIVYQTGGTAQWYDDMISNTSIQRYVNTDGDIELVDEINDANMGDPDTLADFVSWGIENYPAKRMGLVFWNHGGGSISGVCFDELHDSDSLSLREIDSALNSVYDKMTDKFEFIGFDACLMSTLETANILVPYARYMFASEETEPGGGWNYTDIMNFLAENPDADGSQLGKFQCESYYQHCIDNGDSDGTTFAITDLSKLDELLTAFDKTAKEMYEYDDFSDIARAAYSVDNFGGNNRNEGYTNMVDLYGLLQAVQPYAPSATEAISALGNAVICNVNGISHEGAGGISLYYPLSVQGTEELSIFSDICTSTYYLAFVDAAAYGKSSGDISGYNNSGLFGDTDDFWSEDYTPDSSIDNSGTISYDDDASAIDIQSIYFDDDGVYTVQLGDMDAFNYATCTLFMTVDAVNIYLGEDDEVDTDYDTMTLRDSFDGSWPSIAGQPLAIVAVSVDSDRSVYTAPISLNGEQTNLRIEYDWNAERWNVLGTWGGIDPETGAASRETVTLKDGDVIAPAYYVFSDEFNDYIYGNDIVISGDIDIEYDSLPASDYSYSMTIYDVYGSYYYTDSVTFTCNDDGSLSFYPDELNG